MKQTWKKAVKIQLAAAMAVVVAAGCGGSGGQKASPDQPAAPEKPKETPYLEVWRDGGAKNPLEKDGVVSKWLIKETGIGVYSPVVPWEGGSAYIQRLNTRVAGGNLPDLFLPWQGNEVTLAKQGAIADLTNYLPKHAPNVWNGIPKEIWDIVRSSDPEGKGRIFYIPQVNTYTTHGTYIRQDWLDRVGMKMPTTKDEYVEVLKAFRDKDANGNGNPNDEIPVAGREFGRWMDHLFAMYGVAMWEGLPVWDLYDGKLTYSAVTPNMKAALEFIHMLYKEKLLDNNTFLNKNDEWTAKIYQDKVGNWFHINVNSNTRVENIAKVNKQVNLAVLPLPKVPGYNGFITKTQINRPQWVIANKNEDTIINSLKLLDWHADKKNMEKALLGVEGMHFEVKDGKKVLIPFDSEKHELRPITPFFNTIDSLNKELEFQSLVVAPDRKFAFDQRDKIVKDGDKFGKAIAGDGLPATIYEGLADIRNHVMYQEYMTKIIIGDWPISKFDEFVDKWNKSGGETVTKRAREWHEKLKK